MKKRTSISTRFTSLAYVNQMVFVPWWQQACWFLGTTTLSQGMWVLFGCYCNRMPIFDWFVVSEDQRKNVAKTL